MRASSINYIVTIVCLVAVGFGCNLGAQENLYVAKDPGSKGLRWVSDSGKTAFLQQSQDLVRWEYMLHYDVGDGSERLFQPSQNLVEDNKGLIFYRLQTYPTNLDNPDDTDGDGLHNLFELSHGYVPIMTDSDNDGVADGDEDLDEDGESNLTEIANGTDAGDSSSNSGDEDFDEDGLSNKEEGVIGTDPNRPDTDGDDIIDSRTVGLSAKSLRRNAFAGRNMLSSLSRSWKVTRP